MSEFDTRLEIVFNLIRRKKYSRESLRSLTPEEKIAELVALQERYYRFLVLVEQNGGRLIPERWRKWHKARYETSGNE